ncbi:MAG: serine protease [Pseudorhodoplanes sp.]|nr:serine protease [Pseudorhodoplanes sp.]
MFFGVPGEDGGVEYGGTGFLVSFPSSDYHEPFAYIVTARHVANALSKWEDTGFHLRVNTVGGGSVIASLVVMEWHFHPDPTVDLAVFSGFLGPPKYDQWHFRLDDHLWFDHRIPNIVACGDEVNLVGLFRLHVGSKRNVPIVHSGHVALLPDPKERVPIRDRTTGEIVESEVFLIEAQTLDGLSGSPVFMHEVVNLEGMRSDTGYVPKAYGGVRFLGLYTGSWDGEPGAILAADRNLKGAKRIPVGMGTVVPALKLIELLRDHPKMQQNRKQFVEKKKAEGAAVSDSAIPAPQATDANPKHQEDFTRLVSEAARKREQED